MFRDKKKILMWGAILMVAFYVFTRPTQAAASLGGLFDLAMTGADRISTFLSALGG